MKHTFEDWSFGGHRTMESWLEEMALAPHIEVKLSVYRYGPESQWGCLVTLYPKFCRLQRLAYGEGAHPYDAVLACARDYWERGNEEAA